MNEHDKHNDDEQGRREHYGAFYGLHEIPSGDRPLVVVLGNCQAEALRIALSSTGSEQLVDSVRVPPVHELSADDVPHLQRLLSRVDVLVAQPVREDYHDLAVGTTQVAARLRPQARLVRIPVIFYSGLYPYQVLARADGVGDPPVAPYHDLRTLALVGGRSGGPGSLTPQRRLEVYRQIASDSVQELAVREDRDDTLPISDLLTRAGAGAMWTINHPGNELLLPLAGRVRDHLGLASEQTDPGRVLLSSVLTPLLPEVIEALGLAEATPREDWVLGGQPTAASTVHEAQQQWYAEHPQVVEAGLERHRDRLALLGWSG